MDKTPEIDPLLFRETLGYFPTGVVVITAIDDTGSPAGMVVGSFTSVSLDPPLVAYLPAWKSGSFARLRTSSHFVVNVLAADQTDLCNRIASRGADKFVGVEWTPAPVSGGPVLADAVSWMDCEVRDEYDGGDHAIVVGKVLDLGVQRPALPLVFFQGGFGRFALPSGLAPTDPDLIEAVRHAEPLRLPVRAVASAIGADCSLMARVGDEAVFLTADGPTGDHGADTPAVGHRIPLIPPVGTVFYVESEDAAVDQWLARAKAPEDEVARFRAQLAAVRAKGYSVSLKPGADVDRIGLMNDYSGSDVMPVHERRLRQMIRESTGLYEPELIDGQRYDLHSVILPVPSGTGQTKLAVRLSGLPQGVTRAEVERWVSGLQRAIGGATDAQDQSAASDVAAGQ